MTEQAQIRIRKLNHAFLQIESEFDLALEMSESFKFEVKNAKFSPMYKMGRWDGFIKLFNMGSRIIGSGLLPKVIDFCTSRGYSYDVIANSAHVPTNISRQEVSDYMQSLNLHARGVPLEIRDYQLNGVYTALKEQKCILLSATGSGKSMLIYSIFRYITEELDGRVLLIVPTVGLVTQINSDFKDYSSHNGYNVDNNMHLISAGVKKETNKKIVVSTFQSLKDVGQEWLNSFDCILSDEGHKIAAESFKTIYDKATEVPFRIACTGTLSDTKCDLLQMQSLTGPIFEIALAKTLIAANQLVPLRIKAITINYPVEIRKQFKKVAYEDEIGWIITNSKRNNFIKKLALTCKGTTIVFFRFVEHGKTMFDLIKDCAGDREVCYISGEVDKDDRELIRLSANSNDSIIVASLGCMSTGINLPAISNMIMAHPTKSKLTVIQAIGRGLRLKEGKTHCSLFDIGDQLGTKSRVNFAYKHFGERLQMYIKEGHEFSQINVDF
jgi:superfamily II DNA or RNA helicase